MQLIQIGEVEQKTVLDLVQEMARKQLAEIEQLKSAARTRTRVARTFRGRQRCKSSKTER
jgi:hypothetical protein